ncbi:hypothetical protein LLG96_03735 [bacterium]|nr:hypothetical protein [bacterium]
MLSHADAMKYTYIWLAIYGLGTFTFFAIGIWVIIRGGKDVLEMMTTTPEDKK